MVRLALRSRTPRLDINGTPAAGSRFARRLRNQLCLSMTSYLGHSVDDPLAQGCVLGVQRLRARARTRAALSHMLELKPGFRQLHRTGEYPRLEDMGLIGDGTTAALVCLDGSIPWLCLPRFDSEPVFCGLLDVAKGGHFIVAPEHIVEARQYYELDTAVLHTEFLTTKGRVRVTDAMAVRAGADLTDDAPCGRAELVRSAVVLDGSVQLRVELEPRGGGSVQPASGGLHIRPSRQPSLNLHLRSNRPLESLC